MAAIVLIAVTVLFAVAMVWRKAIINRTLPLFFSLDSLLIGYVGAGFSFAVIYLVIDSMLIRLGHPKLFSSTLYEPNTIASHFLNYVYFSFISQLTVGFGDISPTHPISKALTVFQGLLGVVFMGGLITTMMERCKSVMNFLYVRELSFRYASAKVNIEEVFNLHLSIEKTAGSVFKDFVWKLIAIDKVREFEIQTGTIENVNVKDSFQIAVNRKGILPEFTAEDDQLGFNTIDPPTAPRTQVSHGVLKFFPVHTLILEYQYVFESQHYTKRIQIRQPREIAKLFQSHGDARSPSESFARH